MEICTRRLHRRSDREGGAGSAGRGSVLIRYLLWTSRRRQSIPEGQVEWCCHLAAIGFRCRLAPDKQIMFARRRSVLYAYPFAPDRKDGGHDHRAEEEPDQSKCSQPAKNSYQCQQERQPRRASDERRLNEVIAD